MASLKLISSSFILPTSKCSSFPLQFSQSTSALYSLYLPYPLHLAVASYNTRHHRSNLFCSVTPLSSSDIDEEFEEDDELLSEEVDEALEESDIDDSGIDVDVDVLEREAKLAVKELSDTLARELIIDDEYTSRKKTRLKKKMLDATRKSIPDHLLPRVAIVGRPNVGKSALFNRLVGGNKAIVVDEPGVTRDRLYGRSFWGDYEFMVVDTGGVVTISKSQNDVMEELAISTTIGMEGIPLASREAAVARMPTMVEKQAALAVEESSVIVFLVDGQAGLTAADVEIGDWLRKKFSHKFIVFAVNKCESPRKGFMQASEFWSLGFSPIPISAISGTGTGELLDLICSGLKKVEESETAAVEEDYVPAIAIVGRPNVGKSSILNALVREDRTIVSPISATTRDAIDMDFSGSDGQKFRLIDTAGIRKRTVVASLGSTTEALCVNRAFRAIRRSDVVALVIEAMACITEQDVKIAERIEKKGKGCLIVVNKWDTIPNKNHETTAGHSVDKCQDSNSSSSEPTESTTTSSTVAPTPPSSASVAAGSGFGSSSATNSVNSKKKQQVKKERPSVIRRTPLGKPNFESRRVDIHEKEKSQNESAFLLAWSGLGAIIILEGILLAASGFLPEEWDRFFVKYLYPSFTPTVFLFLAGTVSYGVLKYLQNEKPQE